MTRRAGSLLVLFAIFIATIGTSEAGHPGGAAHKDAVLYELTEHASITIIDKVPFRIAESALEGKVELGTPLCQAHLLAYAKVALEPLGIRLARRCTVVAIGRSQIDLRYLTGSISGEFWVVVNTEATNLADAAEFVIMYGTFAGDIEGADLEGLIIDILPGAAFTPVAALPGFPLDRTPASFTGKFRRPFTFNHIAAYKSDRGTPIPVRSDERALGDATVRVEISFD